MKINYIKICSDLTNDLSLKGKEIISKRFGLENTEKETLESIGKDYEITRERVRQIQEDAISKIKPKTKKIEKVFDYFVNKINSYGGLRKEDLLLDDLGNNKYQNHALFLLTLGDPFVRFLNTDEHHSFWTTDPNLLSFTKKTIGSFHKLLKDKKEPISLREISFDQVFGENINDIKTNFLSWQAAQSYLEISKKIQKNKEGLFGLNHWPEINPKGIKDKAYLIIKKENKPLHFNEVAFLINKEYPCNPQSVHNELIKDKRFVLVGRGTYALKEWGYKEGIVKDIIIDLLKNKKALLTKEEIVEEVLKQRLVKPNTVLLSLSDKKHFSKNLEGKYTFKRGKA